MVSGSQLKESQLSEDQRKLMLAIISDDFEAVEKLITEKKVNINFATEGLLSETPLHVAAKKGYDDVVGFFLEKGAVVDAKDNFRRTPLHAAAFRGHADVVSILLEKGAAVDAENYMKNTPLHLAAKKGHVDVVKVLLENGADVEAKNQSGNTPLHLAAESGHADVVKILIEKGAVVDAKNNDQNTPLHVAARKGHVDVVKEFMKAGTSETLHNVITIIKDSSCFAGVDSTQKSQLICAVATLAGKYLSDQSFNEEERRIIDSCKEYSDRRNQIIVLGLAAGIASVIAFSSAAALIMDATGVFVLGGGAVMPPVLIGIAAIGAAISFVSLVAVGVLDSKNSKLIDIIMKPNSAPIERDEEMTSQGQRSRDSDDVTLGNDNPLLPFTMTSIAGVSQLSEVEQALHR